MQTLILLTRDTARIDPQILRDMLNEQTMQKFGRPPPSLDNAIRLETRGGSVTVTRVNRPWECEDIDLILPDCAPDQIAAIAQHRRYIQIDTNFDDPQSDAMILWATAKAISQTIQVDLFWDPEDHALLSAPPTATVAPTTPAPTYSSDPEPARPLNRTDRFLRSISPLFPDADRRKQERKAWPVFKISILAAVGVAAAGFLSAAGMIALFGTAWAIRLWSEGLTPTSGSLYKRVGIVLACAALATGYAVVANNESLISDLSGTSRMQQALQTHIVSSHNF